MTLAIFLLDAHPWKALVFAVIFIVYQEIESHTLYPIVMGRTVKIGAISVFFATLAGAELAGILGARPLPRRPIDRVSIVRSCRLRYSQARCRTRWEDGGG